MKLAKMLTGGALAALMMACSLPLPAAAAAKNMLRNPDMETMFDHEESGVTEKRLKNWDFYPGPSDGGFVRDAGVTTSVKHSGSQGAYIKMHGTNAQAIYQYCTAEDKQNNEELKDFDFTKDYTFSVWIKLDNVSKLEDYGVMLCITQIDRGGSRTENEFHLEELGTQDWKKYSVSAKGKKNLIQFDVKIHCDKGAGTVYIDDASLTEGIQVETTTTTLAGGSGSTSPAGNTTAAANNTTQAVSPGVTTAPGESQTEGSGEVGETTVPASDDKPSTTAAGASTTATTGAVPGSTEKDPPNILPFVIGGAVVVAGAGVALAYVLIKRSRPLPEGPDAPDGPDDIGPDDKE